MLDCRKDRLDYGNLLTPPAGFQFDQAVAATFSADLGTLLALPIPLLFGHTLEGAVPETRLQLLDAVKRFAARTTVFHQKGRLHVPSKLSFLHALLEDALAPVMPDGPYSSFHPKIWVIRYRSREDPTSLSIRFLSLSRNLTMDRSWDVAASLDGPVGKTPRRLNVPLVTFQNPHLCGFAAKKQIPISDIARFFYISSLLIINQLK